MILSLSKKNLNAILNDLSYLRKLSYFSVDFQIYVSLLAILTNKMSILNENFEINLLQIGNFTIENVYKLNFLLIFNIKKIGKRINYFNFYYWIN